MNKYLFVLNIICTTGEVLICSLGIIAFAMLARYFDRWWIALFCLIPLLGYNGWKLVVDSREEGDVNAKH